MTHYTIVPTDQWNRLIARQAHRKRLADPVADVFFVSVLAVTFIALVAILVFAG